MPAPKPRPTPGDRRQTSPEIPTPATMAGSRDPALSVRPVDYSAATRDHARRSITHHTNNDAAPSSPTGATPESGLGAKHRQELATRIMAALQENTNRRLTAPDSLYSVVSGKPVPTGESLHLTAPRGPVNVVGAWDATLEDLQRCVEDPQDSWSADLGRTDYFLRGELCVQIRRTDAQIVGIYHAGWALARRPDDPLPEEPGSGRSASGGRGTRYPTNQAELLKRLRSAGFRVVTSGPTHGKITHPDHPGRFLPYASTPSGQRYGRHVVTAVKRVFGIDLRA
ncbi:hypothetical protein [Kocuria sp.]|uniref:hypothetical protein n=1 Tax=Kocuria sp. TaxID=1871328 RepID=UPI0026DFAF2C|nr:hypothetical protein [Kocuria sp.]MDO5619739.1 hypothetical protein [Kocuria sp.]